MDKQLNWNEIEEHLGKIANVHGGFSIAKRGLISLGTGEKLFVKIGIDENTKKWANKEIAVYRILAKYSFGSVPELKITNLEETGFALEALTAERGWKWSEQWSEERLNKTLATMESLAAIRLEGTDKDYFSSQIIDEGDDGWKPLAQSEGLQLALKEKLRYADQKALSQSLDFAEQAKRSKQFVFHPEVLVHNDVRADNCAWNPTLNEVRLVDWNWAQIGDARIDMAAMLVHVQNAGFDVVSLHSSKLDADALQWLAGFWFKSAATPMWEGGSAHLRDVQLYSGVTALRLSNIL